MGRNKKNPKHKKPEHTIGPNSRSDPQKTPSPSLDKDKDKPLVSLSFDTVLTESNVKSLLRILSSASGDKKR
ncbi:MAG: hypothetical protein HQL72_07585 [Magnetococcales bacterium]|nr:hypothetical protein [Magnetococcales bacterium]